jgi:5-methylcytosine-specific restriction endonuclease McrA
MTVAQIKAAVRARDGLACTLCGLSNADHLSLYSRQLEVHRVVPRSAYSIDPGVCITTCRPCHRKLPKAPPGTPDPYQTPLAVLLPADAHRQLKKLAEREKRPVNWQLRLIVEDALQAAGLWPPPPP